MLQNTFSLHCPFVNVFRSMAMCLYEIQLAFLRLPSEQETKEARDVQEIIMCSYVNCRTSVPRHSLHFYNIHFSCRYTFSNKHRGFTALQAINLLLQNY